MAEENVWLQHPNDSNLMRSFLTGEGWGETAEGLRKMFYCSIQMTVNWCDHFSLVKDGESWMVTGNVLLQRPNNNRLMWSFLTHEGWGETAESGRKTFCCGIQTTITNVISHQWRMERGMKGWGKCLATASQTPVSWPQAAEDAAGPGQSPCIPPTEREKTYCGCLAYTGSWELWLSLWQQFCGSQVTLPATESHLLWALHYQAHYWISVFFLSFFS